MGPVGLAALVEALPLGLAIGPVVLDDGRVLLGFLGSHGTETVGTDITAAGGWRGRR
jgi:hypothetical protein